MAERGPNVTFSRLEQHRAHEYVAEQLRREIGLGLILSGSALPPERLLAKMFGVGRATVQRAIGLLEADGLVERRRGRNGGTFVRGQSRGRVPIGDTLARLRRDRGIILDALEFRLDVEPLAAARAVKARTNADLAAMAQVLAQAAAPISDADAIRLDAQFHRSIAQASQNRFFVESVERIRRVLTDALIALPDSDLWQQRSIREHRAIHAAIQGDSVERARRSMQVHLQHTDKSVRALLEAL
jgi:GntR family transcriptional regulator, transcriptional repressor for pyruvate dehydrogenase complex